MEAHENELWSYLPEPEMERRWSLAESLIGSTSEHVDSAARAVATLHNLIYLDGDEINLCANSPQWPFGGGGGSYWSMQLCDLGDITPVSNAATLPCTAGSLHEGELECT